MGFVCDSSLKTSNVLQEYFSAPESWNASLTSTALDIYSIGVIIFWIVANNYPYQKEKKNGEWETNDEFRERLYKDLYLDPARIIYPLPTDMHWDKEDPDRFLRRPMAMCLANNPRFRPTAVELVEILKTLEQLQLDATNI